MERMREIPCDERHKEICKYAGTVGCHLSIHHIYPRRTVENSLQKRYSNDPRNKILACRAIHDALDLMPPPDYPSDERMKRFLGDKNE